MKERKQLRNQEFIAMLVQEFYTWFRHPPAMVTYQKINYTQIKTNVNKCIVYTFKSFRWVGDFILNTSTGDKIKRVDVIKYLGVKI